MTQRLRDQIKDITMKQELLDQLGGLYIFQLNYVIAKANKAKADLMQGTIPVHLLDKLISSSV